MAEQTCSEEEDELLAANRNQRGSDLQVLGALPPQPCPAAQHHSAADELSKLLLGEPRFQAVPS